ncbi:unnamed protein product [Camellia sinensis]
MQCILQDTYYATRSHLVDAGVNNWVAEFGKFVYETEDILETYVIKVSSKRGFRNTLKRFACIFNEWIAVCRVRSEIGTIKKRITNHTTNLYNVVLKSRGEGIRSLAVEKQQELRQSYQHVVEEDFVGFEEDLNKVVKHLVQVDDHTCRIRILGRPTRQLYPAAPQNDVEGGRERGRGGEVVELASRRIVARPPSPPPPPRLRLLLLLSHWLWPPPSLPPPPPPPPPSSFLPRQPRIRTHTCSPVVSICGMGGLGKTTLAIKVFRHEDVRSHFDCLAWVCMSQQYQTRDILRSIFVNLVPVSKEAVVRMTNEELFEELCEVLKGKKCLVVLDDIWSMEVWESLKLAFVNGNTCNKILLTTRNKTLSSQIDRYHILHEPQCLNNEESWDLFQKKSLLRRDGREMLGIEDGAFKMTLGSVGGPWGAFVDAFQGKFLSSAAREKLREQFCQLKQQGLSVAEFEATFTSLSRFAPELVVSEEHRCFEFERKLRRGLKLRVGGSFIREYRRLVDAACKYQYFRGLDTNIMALGREMVKLCAGLPLAIIGLGELLKTTHALREWEMVYQNVRSQKWSDIEGVSKVLALSYDDLPYQLKPCFLYFGLFLKDFEIDAERLYHLWISDGIIVDDDREEGETIMDVAKRYLGELAQRCMVQVQVEKDTQRINYCRIHDLMLDLCLSKAKKNDFLKIIHFQRETNLADCFSTTSTTTAPKIRTLAIHLNRDVKRVVLPDLEATKQLRSILFYNPRRDNESLIELNSHFKDFKLLRNLDLEGFKLDEKSVKSIGNLISLRYLSLRSCFIPKWHLSICKLKYLQTLDLRGCNFNLGEEIVLHSMERLRHLFISLNLNFRNKFKLDGLSNLQTFEGFNTWDCDVNDLFKLINLQQLEATFVETDNSQDFLAFIDYLNTSVNDLRQTSLSFYFSFEEAELTILKKLLRCNHLYKLSIFGFIPKLPKYQDFSSSIIKLQLCSCELQEDRMPTLEWLLCLQFLNLDFDAFVGDKMVCSANGFPQLKTLQLHCLMHFKEWEVERRALRNLTVLTIHYCQELEMVPEGLRFIDTLQQFTTEEMSENFNKKLRGINGKEGEDFYKVRHVSSVSIRILSNGKWKKKMLEVRVGIHDFPQQRIVVNGSWISVTDRTGLAWVWLDADNHIVKHEAILGPPMLSPQQTEAASVLHAMRWASQQGIQCLLLQTDCLTEPRAIREWEMVYQNVRSQKWSDIEGVSKVLALSYDDLPYQLKPCFLYFGLFLKDFEIDAERLYHLWISDGIIVDDDREEGETIMDVAKRYLGELAQRCMVQVQVEKDTQRINYCRIHDLMLDLCLSKAKKNDFLKIIHLQRETNLADCFSTTSTTTAPKIRTLAIHLNRDVKRVVLPDLEATKQLRSILFCNPRRDNESLIELNSHFKDFKLLRNLDLEGFKFDEKSVKSIGNLISLRYLSLRSCFIPKWHLSICKLKYLQTLDLRGCNFNLGEEIVLHSMERLRHLFISLNLNFRNKFKLDGLSNLQTFEGFNTWDCDVNDLFKLINLQQLEATFSETDNSQDFLAFIDYLNTSVNDLRQTSLSFYFSFEEAELTILKKLLRCNHLYKLSIFGFIPELPKYQDFSSSIIKLQLCSCELQEDPMPTLEWLHCLQFLNLDFDAFVGDKMVCSANGFPQLKTLQLHCLMHFKEWEVERRALRNLTVLTIHYCQELEMVPEGLRFIDILQQFTTEEMSEKFNKKLRGINGKEGEDFYKVRHVSSVSIRVDRILSNGKWKKKMLEVRVGIHDKKVKI